MPADFDAIRGFLEMVWPIYEAAEDWQETHQHACDARCTAVNHIPDLTSYLAETVAELRLARHLRDALNAPGSRLLSTQAKQALDAYNQHMEVA